MAKEKKYVNTVFRRIRKLIFSKAFIGAILLAFTLWVYTALNREYKPNAELLLQIKLPAGKAIENPLPSKISVKVKGIGWDIFYLIFFNSSAVCSVDLSGKEMQGNDYTVTRNDLLKGFQFLNNVEPIDVMPENLLLKIGDIGTHTVPIQPEITVNTRQGFTVVGNYEVVPPMVSITGNEKVVRNIDRIKTKHYILNDIFKPFTFIAGLSDSLSNIVKLSNKLADIVIEVQQTASITFYDVEVKVRGVSSLPKNRIVTPQHINVTLQGGIENIIRVTPSMVYSYIDYTQILRDTTGIIKPRVSVSDSTLKIMNIYPAFLYHKKVITSLKERNS